MSFRQPEGFSNASEAGRKLKEMFIGLGEEVMQVRELKDTTKVFTKLTDIGEVVELAIEEYFESAPQPVQDFFNKYKIPKSLIMASAVTAITATLLYVAITYGARILSFFIGVLQPLFYTFKALETEGKDDDTLWLTYWFVYGLLGFLDETVLVPVVSLFPVVYYIAKMAFLIYIVNFNGAVVVYQTALQPFFAEQLEKAEDAMKED